MIYLDVCNRKTATSVNQIDFQHVIISISTPGDPVPDVVKTQFTHGVLYLQFHDLDRDPGPVFREVYGEPTLFTKRDAQNIAAFVAQWIERGVQTFRVHCDAGQSRSVAVAAALARHYNEDDSEWWVTRPYASPRTPNSHVYKVMLEALDERKRDHV